MTLRHRPACSDLCRLFKKEPTAKEVVRESQRNINRTAVGIEREIASLKREEQKLIRVRSIGWWNGQGLAIAGNALAATQPSSFTKLHALDALPPTDV